MKNAPMPVKLFFLAIWAVSIYYSASRVIHLKFQPDPMAFIPPSSPEASAVKEIQRDFGLGDTGIVLVTFQGEVGKKEITKENEIASFIKRFPGILRVMTIDDIPRPVGTAEELEVYEYTQPLLQGKESTHEFLNHVKNDKNIYGNFISRDLKTLAIYVSFDASAVPEAAGELTEKIREKFPEVKFHFQGSPFLTHFLSNELQTTFKTSLPMAALFFFVIFFIVKMPVFTIYTILALGTAVLWTLAVLSHFTYKLDFVTGAIPSILFASGASYVAHILIKGYSESLVPVILSALTTCMGFASTVVLGIAPLSTFGLITALGIAFVAIAAFIISAIFQRENADEKLLNVLGKPVYWLVEFSITTPLPSIFIVLAIGIIAAFRLLSSPVDISLASLFEKGSKVWSEIDQSEKILPGSDFFFLLIRSPYNRPGILRQVDLFEKKAASAGCAYWTSSPADVVKMTARYMTNLPRIPLDEGKLGEILFLVESEPAFQNLVHENQKFLVLMRTATKTWKECNKINSTLAERIFNNKWTVEKSPDPPESELKYLVDVLSSYKKIDVSHLRSVLKVFPSKYLPEEPLNLINERLKDWGFKPLPQSKHEKLNLLLGKDGVVNADEIVKTLGKGTSSLPTAGIVQEMRALARAEALELASYPDAAGYLLDLEDGLTLKHTGQKVNHVLTGSNTAFLEVNRAIKRGQIIATFLTFLLVFVIIFFMFEDRNILLVLTGAGAPLLAVFVGLAGVTYLSDNFDVGTAMAANSLLGMTADFALHFVWSMNKRGLRDAIGEEAPAQFFAILLTTAGFAPLLTSDISSMVNFATAHIIGPLCASIFSMGLLGAVRILMGNLEEVKK